MLSLEHFVSKLKPSCEKFLKSPTKENIILLRKTLETLEDIQLDLYQSYILLPLIVKLENIQDNGCNEVKTSLLSCILHIMSKTRIKNLEAFKTLLIIILKQIHDYDKGSLISNLSEERKLATIECITMLFQRSMQDVLEEFYVKQSSRLVAKIGITLVELISKEKYRLLRISAIKCCMTVVFVHNTQNFDDNVMRNQVANTTFIFLPKILYTLTEIAVGDNKLGESLISLSIQALGRILCLIFEDYEKINDEPGYNYKDFLEIIESSRQAKNYDDKVLHKSSTQPKDMQERTKYIENMERTNDWLSASSRKLFKILRSTSTIRANESVNVRMEYAKMCCDLAEKCFKHLKENFITFLETIITFSQDENEHLRNMCNECMANLIRNQNSAPIFKETVSNLFEIHINQLPNIINRCDNIEQAAEFQFLMGFFRILPEDDLRTAFSFHENVNKFCMCLISAVDLELRRELLTKEYALRPIREENSVTMTHLPWRMFKKIGRDKNIELLQDICNNLGKSSASDMIFDELMNLLPRNLHIYNEIIIILVFLFSENYMKETDTRINYIHVILDEILQESHWYLALQPDLKNRIQLNENTRWYVDSTPGLYESALEVRINDINMDDNDQDDVVTLNDAKFNILHTCVILDAIGNFSLSLGKHFQKYVFKSLHRILHKAGSSNCMVHLSASFALNCCMKALNFEKMSDMIHNFSDYISYHVNISLKKADRSKEAADILSVILQYSSINTLSYLENIISTILDQCTKFNQIKNLTSYLKVCNIFLSNLSKWDKETTEDIKKISLKEDDFIGDNKYDEWLSILNKQEDIRIEDNPENLNDETNETDEIAKEPIPKHIQLAIEVLQNVLKYVSSKDQAVKIMSMECLISGLPVLRLYENELLPIVHLIWYHLTQRFKDKDPIILSRCFTLFNVLATYSKDFLLSRSLKEVIPFLSDFLECSARNSMRDINLAETQEFKLQVKLIQELPNLIISLGVDERELDAITGVIILYLDKNQPKLLQELSHEYFKQIFNYNRPLAYIKLTHFLNTKELKENIDGVLNVIRI